MKNEELASKTAEKAADLSGTPTSNRHSFAIGFGLAAIAYAILRLAEVGDRIANAINEVARMKWQDRYDR